MYVLLSSLALLSRLRFDKAFCIERYVAFHRQFGRSRAKQRSTIAACTNRTSASTMHNRQTPSISESPTRMNFNFVSESPSTNQHNETISFLLRHSVLNRKRFAHLKSSSQKHQGIPCLSPLIFSTPPPRPSPRGTS